MTRPLAASGTAPPPPVSSRCLPKGEGSCSGPLSSDTGAAPRRNPAPAHLPEPSTLPPGDAGKPEMELWRDGPTEVPAILAALALWRASNCCCRASTPAPADSSPGCTIASGTAAEEDTAGVVAAGGAMLNCSKRTEALPRATTELYKWLPSSAAARAAASLGMGGGGVGVLAAAGPRGKGSFGIGRGGVAWATLETWLTAGKLHEAAEARTGPWSSAKAGALGELDARPPPFPR